MNPEEQAAQIIELPQNRFGPQRSRKASKCLPSHHTATEPKLHELAAELIELKKKKRRLQEKIDHVQAQIRESSMDLKLDEASKGKRISRINIALPEAPSQPRVQVQVKNQFRDIDVSDYPTLYNDIGPEAFEAFVEEAWFAKTQPGFNEGDFLDSIILGITELLGDGKLAEDAAWFCWNTCQRWLSFDVKLKVKNTDFSFRLGNMRERMTPSQRAAMRDFCNHAMYKPAVTILP